MIDAKTGAVQFGETWCQKDDTRPVLERRLPPFYWKREMVGPAKDEIALFVKTSGVFGAVYFGTTGISLIKIGLDRVYKKPFALRAAEYKKYLAKVCGLTPGTYPWGKLVVSEDPRDASSDIGLYYD
jgi:hypothetical protein